MADLLLRPIVEEEFPAWSRAVSAAFGAHVEHAEDWIVEYDRTVAVFDGDEIVANAGAFTFDLTLPGLTSTQVAGVTAVGVRTDHRRQGLLTRMMEHQLDDVASRGEALAILLASESIIYGRFGYGMASSLMQIEVDSSRDAFLPRIPITGTVRPVDADAAAKTLPAVHDVACRQRAGDMPRVQKWWDIYFTDREKDRGGASARFYAVHESAPGQADGYVSWRIKQDWDSANANNQLRVDEMVATTPEATAALWRYIFDVDLVGTVTAWVPLDEPLRWMLSDPRRMLTKNIHDFLWVRLLDIPAAMTARRYDVEDSLVVEVADAFRPSSAGRYRITGGPGGAECARTTDDADLALDITDLGALYLGGTTATQLAQAQRGQELTAGARGRADRFFATSPLPYCRTDF
ncbi:MAG: GNAT family N-acetyltransferase [Actinobacteria bacterium]|nr:GNAT family N-acetyltransferase [Actinomycetota bacterium]